MPGHPPLRRLAAVAIVSAFLLPLTASAAVAAPAPVVSSERFVAHLDPNLPTELHSEIAAGLRIVDAAIDGPKRTINVSVAWDPNMSTASGGPAGYVPTRDRGDGQPGCLPAALYEHMTGRDWKSDPDAIDVTVRIRADLDYWRRYGADTSRGIYLEPLSKTIAHEITHGLGIVSLGHSEGHGHLEFRSCTIGGQTVYDPLSELLVNADGRRLVDLSPSAAYSAATTKMFFSSATLDRVIGDDIRAWTPNPFDAGSSLSHPTGTLPGDGLLSYPADLQTRAVGRPSVGLLAAVGWQTRPLPTSAPQSVWVSANGGHRTVEWTAVGGAADYEVFTRTIDASGARGKWTRHITAATSLALPGANRLEVVVRGANAAGGGPTSAPLDTSAPQATRPRAEQLPPGLSRLAGQSRYETAASIAAAGWPKGAETVLVATGTDFPDALAGAAVANVYGAPVLLTAPDHLPEATRTTLQKLKPSSIAVLGGPGAISDAVVSDLQSIAGNVVRWSGSSRTATAAAIATAVYDDAATAYLATAGNFPDALAGAVAASKDRAPILLTGRNELDPHARATLEQLGVTRVVVLGGGAAVSDAVVDELRTAGYAVTRLAGDSRYATAAAVSAVAFPQGSTTVHLATGASFPDALAGAALAARQGPLLLVPPSGQLPAAVSHELGRLRVETGKAFGGVGAVATDVLEQVGRHLSRS